MNKQRKSQQLPSSITTSNKYLALNEVLNDDEQPLNENVIPVPPESSDDAVPVKPVNPPPMFFRGVIDTVLARKIRDVCPNFTLSSVKRGRLDETKISTNDSDSYRLISKFLEERKYSFYSFQSRKNRGTAFVIKNIPCSTERDDIKTALEELNFKVNNVYSLKKPRKDSVPLDMFKVVIDCNAAEKQAMLKLDLLLYRRVKVELFVTTEPTRCNNCNEYGHSKNYCNLPTVCVFCSGLHATEKCNFKYKKCSNCGESHTANYRGCDVFKVLKKNFRGRNTKPNQEQEQTHFKLNENDFKPLPIKNLIRNQPEVESRLNFRSAVVNGNEQMRPVHDIGQSGRSATFPNIEETLLKMTSQFEEFTRMMKDTIFTLMENLGKLVNFLLSQHLVVNDK